MQDITSKLSRYVADLKYEHLPDSVIEQTKLFDFIGFLGTFTLEAYVFHIAYRVVLLNHLKISVKSFTEIGIFLIFYTVTSFVFGYLLSLVLKKIKIGKKRGE